MARGFLRLAGPDGRVLELGDTVEGAGLGDGDSITAVAWRTRLAATQRAFALWGVGSDSVATWGDAECGADSSRVQDRLRNVQQIYGTDRAFAAILEGGHVITWGDGYAGGSSSSVQHELRNVQQIQATGAAFAAVLADHSAVTWGDPEAGGDSTRVQDQLGNVREISGTKRAFAAHLPKAKRPLIDFVGPCFGHGPKR